MSVVLYFAMSVVDDQFWVWGCGLIGCSVMEDQWVQYVGIVGMQVDLLVGEVILE